MSGGVCWVWGGGVGVFAEFGVGSALEYFVHWRSVRVWWKVLWSWGEQVVRHYSSWFLRVVSFEASVDGGYAKRCFVCVGRKGSSGCQCVSETYLLGCVREGLDVGEDGEMHVHWRFSV